MNSVQQQELLVRCFCDCLDCEYVDAVFLHSQTNDNQESVFQVAKLVSNDSRIGCIRMIHSPSQNGYPGYEIWRNALLQESIEESQIKGVPFHPSLSLNTLTESEAMVRLAKENSFRVLWIVASPFQQLRAFMTMISVSLREYPELKVYSRPGSALSWLEEVVHSQGVVRNTRSQLIHSEFDRIRKYQDKGDIASNDEILTYLNQRDGQLI